jgi:hypothetical protein
VFLLCWCVAAFSAGARALQCLPSCYTLLEACLEVLVSQVSCLEELADLSTPAEPQQQQQQDRDTAAGAGAGAAAAGGNGVGPDGVMGGRAVSWQDVLPVLGIKEVEQLMTRMGQVTEVRHTHAAVLLLLLHVRNCACCSHFVSTDAAADRVLGCSCSLSASEQPPATNTTRAVLCHAVLPGGV